MRFNIYVQEKTQKNVDTSMFLDVNLAKKLNFV